MTGSSEPPGGRRWAALAVLCAGSMMIIIDQTIVSVALPSIRQDLGFSEPGLAWVVNGYAIPFGGLLLLAGRFGDLLGRKRMFASGMAVFTGASLACGLAGTAPMLITARFAQGIGGAMTAAVILGIIAGLFPARGERARAIGVFSFVQAAGGSAGSLLGGVVTQALSWHWIFFINIPIGLATVVLAARLVAADRGIGLREGADVAGGLLATGGLMLAGYTIVEATSRGFASAHTLGSAALAAGLLTGFAAREATAAKPLLPVRIFRSRGICAANAIQALLVAGMFGFLFFSVLYLRQSLRYDAIETGLAMMPVAIAIAAVSLGLSARLTTRFGERPVLLAGLAPIVAGLALLSRASADASFMTGILPAMVLIGTGFGLAMPSLMTLGMAGVPAADSGVASGVFNTSQQTGGALGLSALAVLAADRYHQLTSDGLSSIAARTGGYDAAFLAAACLAAAALAITAVVLRRPARDRPRPKAGGPRARSTPPAGAEARTAGTASQSPGRT